MVDGFLWQELQAGANWGGGRRLQGPEKTRSVDPAARCAGPVDSTSGWAQANSRNRPADCRSLRLS